MFFRFEFNRNQCVKFSPLCVKFVPLSGVKFSPSVRQFFPLSGSNFSPSVRQRFPPVLRLPCSPPLLHLPLDWSVNKCWKVNINEPIQMRWKMGPPVWTWEALVSCISCVTCTIPTPVSPSLLVDSAQRNIVFVYNVYWRGAHSLLERKGGGRPIWPRSRQYFWSFLDYWYFLVLLRLFWSFFGFNHIVATFLQVAIIMGTPLLKRCLASFAFLTLRLGKDSWHWCWNKLAKLGDAIAISNLKLSLTDWLTH